MAYREEVLRLSKLVDKVVLMRLPMSDNGHADALAQLASSLTTQDSGLILVEYLKEPSVMKIMEEVFGIKEDTTWMDHIIARR